MNPVAMLRLLDVQRTDADLAASYELIDPVELAAARRRLFELDQLLTERAHADEMSLLERSLEGRVDFHELHPDATA